MSRLRTLSDLSSIAGAQVAQSSTLPHARRAYERHF
jgi:hypothetical protein